MNDLHAFEGRLAALIANLSPASRKEMAAEVAKKLRAKQQANIKAQRAPDGTAFAARKTQKIREKKGRVKREMFIKMRTNKYMKAKATANDAAVEFTGKVQRMARVHHYGLWDRIRRDNHGKEVKYDTRPLLGFSEDDIQDVESIIIIALSKNG